MKVITVALAFVALAIAAPVNVKEPPKIVHAKFNQQPNGAFVFGFATDNGIVLAVVGEIKEVLNKKNEKQNVFVVGASYSYVKADGSVETVTYYGDKTVFHAEGDSIPKVPVVARR